MIKVNNKMLKKFITFCEEHDEFLFYDNEEYLKEQLQTVLNTQGYWSGNYIRIYYNKDSDTFTTINRW